VSEHRAVYEKLLEDLRKELEENQRDLRKAADHYDELIVERRELMAGIFGIEEELRSGLNDD
jgi:preprotein translocase subunit SecA